MRLISLGLLALASTLAGCGGDGNGSAPPTGTPPSFGATSIDVSYAENGTGPVTTLTLNAEATANIGLQISGPDASLFALDAARALRFVTPPDFETPRDQGANNVYNITVRASDTTGAQAFVDITVTVTNDPIAGARFVDPVFASTTSIATVPLGSGDLAVSLIAPVGDTMIGRPLVLVAPSSDAASGLAIAEGFAQRGYVAGLITGTAQSYSDSLLALGSAVNLFSSPTFDSASLGINGTSLFVAGEGVGAQAAGTLGVGASGFSPVVGAFAMGGGLFDPGRASGTSAVMFAAGDARQGGVMGQAYLSSGVPMQFMTTGAMSASERAQAIAGAALLFNNQVLGGHN